MNRKTVKQSEKLKAIKYLIDLMPKDVLAEYIVGLHDEIDQLSKAKAKSSAPLSKFLKV